MGPKCYISFKTENALCKEKHNLCTQQVFCRINAEMSYRSVLCF